MGWIWSSGAAPKGDASSNATSSTNTAETPAKAPEPAYGDPEIAKFMAQIQAEFSGSGNSNSSSNATATTPTAPTRPKAAPEPKLSITPTTTTSSSSWWPSWGGSSSSTSTSSRTTTQPQPPAKGGETPARLDPVAESLLPTTMSCRQAFDQAFHCNSLGGQWTSVYRDGTVRSCSEQWDDFWFCMRTRAYGSGPLKEEAIRDYYRQKELRKYGPGNPSSTDIWEPRTEKLPPGESFNGRYERPDVSDEEWRLQQIERRRMVHRMLREEEEKERELQKQKLRGSTASS